MQNLLFVPQLSLEFLDVHGRRCFDAGAAVDVAVIGIQAGVTMTRQILFHRGGLFLHAIVVRRLVRRGPNMLSRRMRLSTAVTSKAAARRELRLQDGRFGRRRWGRRGILIGPPNRNLAPKGRRPRAHAAAVAVAVISCNGILRPPSSSSLSRHEPGLLTAGGRGKAMAVVGTLMHRRGTAVGDRMSHTNVRLRFRQLGRRGKGGGTWTAGITGGGCRTNISRRVLKVAVQGT